MLVAENVKALKKALPVLETEYDIAGYTCHYQLFNSKFWGVPQNRERYIVVGTLKILPDVFIFPEEQHEYVPKLSTILEKNVDEKFYIADEKARKIIDQALQRLSEMGTVHATITPDRENKRQNGRRAKEDEAPMFTLTAQDLHGVIVDDTYGYPTEREPGTGLSEGNADTSEQPPGCESDREHDNYYRKRYGKDAPVFPIREATAAGVAVGRYGDAINIAYPESNTRRGRVGKEIAQSLLTSCTQVVIEEKER